MGNTIRREPVSFKIPASPDYKFFNVTDFRGLEMTDNPFTAANNTASDLLNVYVDENNALTTRPRLEKQYDISKNINKFNKVLYCYKLMDKIIFQVLINSTVVRLYYKQGDNLVLIDNDTNNIALPETKLAIFEKKDKIYVMTGTLYCVIKPDNIMYTVRDDSDTYVPTIGISTVNDEGIRVMADYEQKNILSNKYRINYFWDTVSDISSIIDDNGEVISNGYVTTTHTNVEINESLRTFSLNDNKTLLYTIDIDGNMYILENDKILQTVNITAGDKLLGVSNDGKWFLSKSNDRKTIYLNDSEGTLIASHTLSESSLVDNDTLYCSLVFNDGIHIIIVTEINDTTLKVLLLSVSGNTMSEKELMSTALPGSQLTTSLGRWSILKFINTNSNKIALFSGLSTSLATDKLFIMSDVLSDTSSYRSFNWAGGSITADMGTCERMYHTTHFSLDGTKVYSCDIYDNLIWGNIDYSASEIITQKTSTLDRNNEKDLIYYTKISDDGKLIYYITRPFGTMYVDNFLDSVYIYSIEDNVSYKLLDFEKPVEGDTVYNIRYQGIGSWTIKPFAIKIYTRFNTPAGSGNNLMYCTDINLITSTEPLLLVEYNDKFSENTTIRQTVVNTIFPADLSQHTISLNDYGFHINAIAVKTENWSIEHSIPYGDTDNLISAYNNPIHVKWFDNILTIGVVPGYESQTHGKQITIYLLHNEPIILPEQTFDYNAMLRFQNNFWFYGNGNEIRWTGNNDPTYFPEYNYTNLGDTNDVVNDMLLVSYDTAVAFKQNNIYVINPVELNDGTYTYTFVEAKSDVGVIAPQSSIISPLTETPLYVNARGIYGLQQLKNIQSTDRISVLYSENVNKKYLNEDKKSHIQSISRLYWVLFILPGKTSKVYVFDDRTASWYYWELPINITGCWADDLNSYFASDDGKIYILKTNDIIDTNYSPETEYYDDGRKLIPWFWKSQILPLGTMNYSKKLINTTFILTDTDENEEYGLNYKFKAYRKNVSETNATTISNRLNYIQSTTKKTSIPRFNFLQMELSNVEEDLNNNKLRLVGLGLKYELLEGLI